MTLGSLGLVGRADSGWSQETESAAATIIRPTLGTTALPQAELQSGCVAQFR
jgi:hypothetical protein